MTIRPYVNPRPQPLMAWLVDHETALTEAGRHVGIHDAIASGHQVWGGYDQVAGLLKEGRGEALCWDQKPIRWSPTTGAAGWPVRVLRALHPETPAACVKGLARWRDWLGRYRAAPASSVGASGLSLLKGTLEGPLWTAIGDLPPIRFTLGGRQEIGPRGAPIELRDVELHQWDMQAAYARRLGEMRYGGRWVHDAGYPVRLPQHGKLIYVRAKVRIPAAQDGWELLGPLPARPRSDPGRSALLLNPAFYPTGRDIQGVWTWDELVEAELSGCTILRVLDTWIHVAGAEQLPFMPWWDAVQVGREMRGFAGLLAKMTGNATWGQFAIRQAGKRQVLQGGHDGKRRFRELPLTGGGNPSQRAPDLAEMITGRVRAELHLGMRLAGERLVSAHTDGVWILDGSLDDQPGWRFKAAATSMRLVNPQNLAYEDRQGRMVYVVAGIASHRTSGWFEEQWEAELDRREGRPYALRERDRLRDPMLVLDGAL